MVKVVKACCIAGVGALLGSGAAHAATVVLDALPAGWAAAQATPGRQIVLGEPSITFDVATDVFVIDPAVFGITQIVFANDLAANLPSSATVVVVQDAGLAAGSAATAIAAQVTVPSPGFFVYFNSGLDLPRLVYSANLDDDTADLAVLARLTNLAGQPASLQSFTSANFALGTAGLSITKTTTATSATPAAIVDYTIIVTNAGPLTATNVAVADTLPASLQFVSANPSQGTCNAASPVACDLGVIPSGGSATITLSTQVIATAGTITNTATATATESTPVSATSLPLSFAQQGAIPTLSEWMRIALAVLLGVAAVLRLRAA